MSEDGYNLFVVQTPLQLLNAIEAQKTFNKTGELLLFCRPGANWNRMQDLLDLYEVERYSFVKITALFRLFFIPLLFFRYVSLKGKVQSLFFGTYASWSAFLANFLRPVDLVLIDDGNRTVDILTNPDKAGVTKKRVLPVLSKEFVSRASFFTYYADLARSCGRDAVQNTLTHVIQGAEVAELAPLGKDSVIFIGTSILSSYEGIDGVLERILDDIQGRKILYVMHRNDEPERFTKLKKRGNFEAVKFDYPLELVFGALWRENKPEVWTFGSTTIDTLALIYPELEVKVLRLDLQRFLSPKLVNLFISLYGFYSTQPHVELVDDYQ